ncbi:MAG TPA: D-alanyl-D-alanine carboxypeptidase [Chitinophagaceae bacterium]|nr:D-alanyl-D-alanine carboxypeptidase [Chitinophagaceae bacterium]
MMPRATLTIILGLVFYSCSTTKRIDRAALATVIKTDALQTAHVGISVYEPAAGKWWYNYQGDHYFVPASNIKIPTCYAAMKYLGDSLVGLRYFETDTAVFIQPTGDPTLLHRAFKEQPVYGYFKKLTKPIIYVLPLWQSNVYGDGWSWDDYNDDYMPERAALPIYGNTLQFRLAQAGGKPALKFDIPFFRYQINNLADPLTKNIRVMRRKTENLWDVFPTRDTFKTVEIPFVTYENPRLLEDTLHLSWADRVRLAPNHPFQNLYSRPTDSVLRPMLHNSDNFFAEQSLLMASDAILGVMSDSKIIDTILKTDFRDLPQKPRWVDGSGLSRYNLFSPQDFVTILDKMRLEFGITRMERLFPTGGEGSLRNYFVWDSSFMYAKTGSMSGVLCLSGFMYTRKNKLLLFSVLINNHQASVPVARRAVETFLQRLRNEY